MKPGDRIEWVYERGRNDELVAEREVIWSSTMNRYAPIGSGLLHVLVSIDDEKIEWVNEEGTFEGLLDDMAAVTNSPFQVIPVLPRSAGTPR